MYVMQDELYKKLNELFWSIPSVFVDKSKSNVLENAYVCAALADRAEDLGDTYLAREWRLDYEYYCEIAKEAR